MQVMGRLKRRKKTREKKRRSAFLAEPNLQNAQQHGPDEPLVLQSEAKTAEGTPLD